MIVGLCACWRLGAARSCSDVMERDVDDAFEQCTMLALSTS
jgi:hypothetical protein